MKIADIFEKVGAAVSKAPEAFKDAYEDAAERPGLLGAQPRAREPFLRSTMAYHESMLGKGTSTVQKTMGYGLPGAAAIGLLAAGKHERDKGDDFGANVLGAGAAAIGAAVALSGFGRVGELSINKIARGVINESKQTEGKVQEAAYQDSKRAQAVASTPEHTPSDSHEQEQRAKWAEEDKQRREADAPRKAMQQAEQEKAGAAHTKELAETYKKIKQGHTFNDEGVLVPPKPSLAISPEGAVTPVSISTPTVSEPPAEMAQTPRPNAVGRAMGSMMSVSPKEFHTNAIQKSETALKLGGLDKEDHQDHLDVIAESKAALANL